MKKFAKTGLILLAVMLLCLLILTLKNFEHADSRLPKPRTEMETEEFEESESIQVFLSPGERVSATESSAQLLDQLKIPLRLSFKVDMRSGGDVHSRECSWELEAYDKDEELRQRKSKTFRGEEANEFVVDILPDFARWKTGFPELMEMKLKIISPCGFEYLLQDSFFVPRERNKEWSFRLPPLFKIALKVKFPGVEAPTGQTFTVKRDSQLENPWFDKSMTDLRANFRGSAHCDSRGILEFLGLPAGNYSVHGGDYEDWELKEPIAFVLPHRGAFMPEIVMDRWKLNEYCSFWLRPGGGKEIDTSRIEVRSVEPNLYLNVRPSQRGRVCIRWFFEWTNPKVEVYDKKKDKVLIAGIQVEKGSHDRNIYLPEYD
ncbi:MAG: hypothetical protein DWQ01_09710 [Planctomycetota bacterium]|nr:MAG: hypothetical protein DWQ01_09710 [Planctomycetota bacterium]